MATREANIQPTSLATRPTAVPQKFKAFADLLGEQLNATELEVAIQQQVDWFKAFTAKNEKGDAIGHRALAQGLRLANDLNIGIRRGQIYMMEIDGRWRAMVSAYGWEEYAAQFKDRDGGPMYRGYEIVEEREEDRDGSRGVYVRVRIRFGPGWFDGAGRKPRNERVWNKKLNKYEERFDKKAEGKAETMACRRAWEKSPVRGFLPPSYWETAAAFDDEAEIIDMPEPEALGSGAEPDAQPTPREERQSSPSPEKASQAQLRHLFALARDLGFESREQRIEAAGVDSFNDLTPVQANKLIEEWTTLAAARPGVEDLAPQPLDRDEAEEFGELDGQGTLASPPVEDVEEEPLAFSSADEEAAARSDLIERIYADADIALKNKRARETFLRGQLATHGFRLAKEEPVEFALPDLPTEVLAKLAATLERARDNKLLGSKNGEGA